MEKNLIKGYIAQSNCTLTKLHKLLQEKYNIATSVQNLGGKINKQTLKYNEILQIADVLGYEIKWVEKK